MDCPNDYAYLLSAEGRDDLVRLHVEGIEAYLAKL